MPIPKDPEEEPVGDEIPDERADGPAAHGPAQGPAEGSGEGAGLPPADRPDGLSREDELWQAIVENYGERPQIEEIIVDVAPSPRDLTAVDEPSLDDSGDLIGEAAPADPDEHFVPPPPPPLPKPPPARLFAWLGLFGVPTFVLATLVMGISLPSWLGLMLMGWFVGGFVFLVASMKPGPRDGGDDGARI